MLSVALGWALLVAAESDDRGIDGPEADRLRIQAHLERVEIELRGRDVSELSPWLRAARAKNLDRLRAYRLAGRFPRNHDVPGQRVPVFIDRSDRACAVGDLLIGSGGMRVAQEIRAHQNNERLAFIDHPALLDWIAQSGLTATEHAMIQPSYCGCGDEDMPVCGVDGKTYGNACFAETCAMVAVAHDGPCRPDGTTGWPPAGSSDGGSSSSGGEETGSSGDVTSTGAAESSSSTAASSSAAGESSEGGDEPAQSRPPGGCSIGSGIGPSTMLLLTCLSGWRRRR